jgi:hypothetical protein
MSSSATSSSSFSSTLPPDLFDETTIYSLLATLAIVVLAYAVSLRAIPTTSGSGGAALRFLFIWHLADALTHFTLEGSFLYHCFFSYVPARSLASRHYFPTPYNFLGHGADRTYGPQAGGANPFAQLWMVYARADRRWAGVDLVGSNMLIR